MSNHIYTLKHEAAGEPFPFQLGDKTLTIPHISTVDQFELAEYYADDQKSDLAYLIGLFSLLMGKDVKELRALKPTRDDLLDLHTAYLAHCGTSEGESEPSSS